MWITVHSQVPSASRPTQGRHPTALAGLPGVMSGKRAHAGDTRPAQIPQCQEESALANVVVSLPAQQARFLDEQVAQGRHGSASEAVTEALRRYEADVACEQVHVACGEADCAAGRSMDRLLAEPMPDAGSGPGMPRSSGPAMATGFEPHWPEPPRLIQETRWSPFGYHSRKIPESPRLAQLADGCWTWKVSCGPSPGTTANRDAWR